MSNVKAELCALELLMKRLKGETVDLAVFLKENDVDAKEVSRILKELTEKMRAK